MLVRIKLHKQKTKVLDNWLCTSMTIVEMDGSAKLLMQFVYNSLW